VVSAFQDGNTASLFVVGQIAFLRPHVLRALVPLNLPIVAPLLCETNRSQRRANFATCVNEAGNAEESEADRAIYDQTVRGLLLVPFLREAVLIHRSVADKTRFADQTAQDPYAVLSASARSQGIFQYIDNRQIYGVLEPSNPRAARLALMHEVEIRHPSGLETIDTFILFGGIGDQVMWLSLLPAFRRHHAKPITVIAPHNARDVAEMFAGCAFDRIVFGTDSIDPALALTKNLCLAPNEMVAWHPYHGAPSYPEYEDLCVEAGVGVMDLLRLLLGLPSVCPVSAPEVSTGAVAQAADLFRQYGLVEGATVLVSAGAKTIGGLAPQWWNEAVAYLQTLGLVVVSNIANRGRADGASLHAPAYPALAGTQAVDIPLSLVLPFTNLCGYFLATRSGLCDLLACANARKAVVFPLETADPYVEERSKKILAFWSVRRAFDRADVHELIVPNNAAFDPDLLTEWLGLGPTIHSLS
jgi:hypothetical protein